LFVVKEFLDSIPVVAEQRFDVRSGTVANRDSDDLSMEFDPAAQPS
jgi:hypothetical protein